MGAYADTIPDFTAAVDRRLIELSLTTQDKIDAADKARAEKAATQQEVDGGAHAEK